MEIIKLLNQCYYSQLNKVFDKARIIKVFEGLPKFMRVCREGQALF